MRIPKVDSDTRKTFVSSLLTVSPKMTIREVNEKVKEKFGKAMRPPLIQAERRKLTGVADASVTAPAPVVDMSTVGAIAPTHVEPLTTTTEVPSTTIGDLLQNGALAGS